jgi:MFS family permease
MYGTWVCFLAALFCIYEYFLRTFLGTIVYQLSNTLHFNPMDLSWVDVAYFIAYNCMQIPAGLLLDRYGIRFCLSGGSFFCVLGVFLFSTAANFYMAVSGRVLMGFGSAFAFVSLILLLFNWFSKKYSGFLLGLGQFLGVLGPMLVGWPLFKLLIFYRQDWRLLLNHLGWFGVALTLLITYFVRYRQPVQNSALENFSWRLFIQIIQSKSMWMIALYSGFSYTAIALLGTLWGMTYLKALDLSKDLAALAVSVLWLGLALGCPLMGLISDVILRRKSILIVCASVGFMVSLFILFSPCHQPIICLVLYFLLGISGAGQSIAFNMVREISSPLVCAAALGFNNTMIGLINALFIPLIGWIIYHSFKGTFVPTVSVYTYHNFLTGFLFMPLLYLVAIIIAVFFIPETYCRQYTGDIN